MVVPNLKKPELDLSNFELVEAAVRQTERGRWFLDEFGRRSRQRDTLSLLAAMRKIENVVVSDKRGVDFHSVRTHIEDCSRVAAAVRAEVDKQIFPLDPAVPGMLCSIERHLIALAQLVIEGANSLGCAAQAPPPTANASTNPTDQILAQDRFVFR